MAWVNIRLKAIGTYVAAAYVPLMALLGPNTAPRAIMHDGIKPHAINWRLIAVALVISGTILVARRWLTPLFLTAGLGWVISSMFAGVQVASFFAGMRLSKNRLMIFLLTEALLLWVPIIRSGWADTRLRYAIWLWITWFALFALLPLGFGLWFRTLMQAQEDASAYRIERVREHERQRIARELHDLVAHRVALIVLQSGAAETEAKDATGRDNARLIGSIGREAMRDLRQLLGVLRGEPRRRPDPAVDDLDPIAGHARVLGIPTEIEVVGEPRESAPAIAYAMRRIVCESLSNVAKHAGPVPTTVRLEHADAGLTISVRNAPPQRPPPAMPESGLGLIGLRERAQILGGTLKAGPTPEGGFEVQAFLPYKETERFDDPHSGRR